MNIKIKASSVYSLIGNDYGRLWTALRNQFGDGEEQIFAERTPGSGYIQWELPGEDWQALSEAEPLKAAMVRKQLDVRKSAVSAILPSSMADKVFTVPDDSYVWFKDSGSGGVLIRLTAWGYRYPEKIGGTGADGYVPPRDSLVEIAVKVTKSGRPCSGETVLLNGMVRQCDTDGVFIIGALPVGYQFDLEVCGEKRHVVVSESNPIIAFDFPADPIVEQETMISGTELGEESENLETRDDDEVTPPEGLTVLPEDVEETQDESDECPTDSEPFTEPSEPSDDIISDSSENEGNENADPPIIEENRRGDVIPQWASILIFMLIIILTALTYFLSVDVLYS